MLVLWGLALTIVALVPLAYPNWPAASFFSSTLVETGDGTDFLDLFIPANPFRSLAESLVPSVVVFSVV